MGSQLSTSITSQHSIYFNYSANVLFWDSIFVDSPVEVSQVKIHSFYPKKGKITFFEKQHYP